MSPTRFMHFIGSPQVLWPGEVFEAHPIPVRSREFLLSVGLPEVFDWPTFEFGVYDSDLPDLVIGEADDQPILIDAETGIVWIETNHPPHRLFFNSSAELLSRFLCLVHEFQKTPDDDSSQQRAFARMRSEMLALDPNAITTAGRCVWTHWLDEWEFNLHHLIS